MKIYVKASKNSEAIKKLSQYVGDDCWINISYANQFNNYHYDHFWIQIVSDEDGYYVVHKTNVRPPYSGNASQKNTLLTKEHRISKSNIGGVYEVLSSDEFFGN